MKQIIYSRLFLIALFAVSALLMYRGCTDAATRGEGDLQTYRNVSDKLIDFGYKDIRMPPLPDLPESDWLNIYPGRGINLRGKVVLIDFWDYTCVNCLRTLPYIEGWYKRYSKDGLVVIGIHSPEFAFAKKRENLAEAIRRFGITYPVVMDNDFKIWDRFGNQYWPAKYLFDKNGILRYFHFGEGNYGNFEAAIQKLLREENPEVTLPSLMSPVRSTDEPGAVCYLTTPETYLGYERGKIGNKKGYTKDIISLYEPPTVFAKDKFYLEGKWKATPQFVRYADSPGHGKLVIDYIAAQANLVINPQNPVTDDSTSKEYGGKVYVYQNGKPVPANDRSRDLKVDSQGRTYIEVNEPRMYYLIDNKQYGRYLLTLEPTSDSFAAYAFTFVTACETTESSK